LRHCFSCAGPVLLNWHIVFLRTVTEFRFGSNTSLAASWSLKHAHFGHGPQKGAKRRWEKAEDDHAG